VVTEHVDHRREGGRRVLAQALDVVHIGRVGRQELYGHAPRAERDRHRGIREFIRPRGDLERPAADVEQEDLPRRPSEPATDGEERVPRLGLAAEHLEGLTERGLDARDDLDAVGGFPHGAGGGGEELVHPLFRRGGAGLGDRALEGGDPLLDDLAVRTEVPHQAQDRPLTGRGERPPAGPDVGDEQMDGVRADVEDSQAHALQRSGRGIRRRSGAGGRGSGAVVIRHP